MKQGLFTEGNRTAGKFWLLFSVFLLMVTARTFAQGGNVAIKGTVMDPSGAVVAGAQVKVTQKNTSVNRIDVTNGSGQFNVASLPPATYTVSVEAQGFKEYLQDVVLLADQIRDIDVHLQVGETSQQITVEESSVEVNTVTPVLAQVIEQSRVINLPLNGRNAADLTLLVPGANSANGHGTTQGDTKQVPGAEAISVNGARPDQISYNLDGANNQDLMSNTNNPFPFPDALQEFSVQTNSFDAQYGSNAGAVVNVITKSGTNRWHGDAFEFVRNRVFNARNYFATTIDPLKRNQFGGTIGGPIHKDTTFIFFGYQGTRVRSTNNASNAIIPTAANLAGDFTKSSKPVIDPSTGQPFPNQAKIGPISQVALNMAKLLPVSQAASDGSVTYSTPLRQDFNEYVARFDQVLRGGGDRLFGRFYLNRYVHAPSYDGKNLLTVGTGSTVQSQNYALGYTTVFTPSLVNSFTLDVVRAASDRGQGGNVPQLNDLGATVFQLPKSQGGIRAFNVSGFFNIAQFTDAAFVRNTGDIRDNVSWTHGKHSFSFGGSWEHDQSNIRNTDLENGSFTFTADTTNNAMASFMLGHLRSFSQTSGDYSDSRQNVVGVYASDKWKLTQRLTLNIGLRWEPQVPMKEIYGRIQQFRPDAYTAGVHSTVIPTAPAGLFFVGDSYNGITVPSTGQTGDFNNFAPRAGVAFDPTGSGKTAIRGGGGVFFYSRLPGLFLNDAAIVAPFSLRLDPVEPQVGPLENPLVGFPSFTANFPQRFTLSNVPKTVAFPSIVSVYSLQPGVKWNTSTIYDWNVTVERQLRNDTVLHLSYVGLRGTHLRQDVDLNPAPTSSTTASIQPRRPFQPFGDIIENRNSGANGYNALQIDLEKRPTTGGEGILKHITLLANYTFSKAMEYGLSSNGGITDVGSSKGSGMSFYDPRQHAFETGLADYDHTHRLVASYVWNLPRMSQSNVAVRNIVGGWDWTGIYTVTTGDAMTILSGVERSQSGLGADRVDFVGSASQFGGVAPSANRTPCPVTVAHCQPWLNTSLFAQPAIGTYGNVGKNTFRGPTLWNVDMGLLKNFYPIPSHENISFQFRGELFNLFNHPQLADPNVTYSNAAFGTIRATVGTNADSRIIQLALKMMF